MTATRVRNTSNKRTGGADDKATRRYVRQFLVETNDPKDGPIVAIAACGIYRGQPYVTERESDLGALAVAIRAEPVGKSQCAWNVTCDYSSRSADPEKFGAGAGGPGSTGGQGSQTDPNDNPISWRPEREWGSYQVMQALEEDKDGLRMENAANEKFDPPYEIERTITTLIIERNEVLYDPSIAERYENRVNSKPFYGAKQGQVKVKSITGKEQFHNAVRYVRVRYELHFKRWPYTRLVNTGAGSLAGNYVEGGIEGWSPIWLPNLGTMCKESTTSTNLVQVVDRRGRPTSTPMMLNADGTQALTQGLYPNYIKRFPYHEVDLGPLKLEF